MTARGARRLVAVAACALLAACTTPPPSSEPPPRRPVDAALVAQREAAGIADCPVTPAESPQVPGGLPSLVLGCLGSDRQVNLAGITGRPMVVNFWAQWCGPCRVEAPYLTEFAGRAGDQVFMLGVDYDDPRPDLALEFAAQSGWTYPHVTDPLKQTSGPVRFGGIPVTVFVDARGRIVHRHVGAFESAQQIADKADTYLGVRV